MEQKNNTGALFLNDKKESDKHPDLTGNLIDNDGKKWRVAGWQNTSQKGNKYISLKISEFQAPQSNDSDSDDLF